MLPVPQTEEEQWSLVLGEVMASNSEWLITVKERGTDE